MVADTKFDLVIGPRPASWRRARTCGTRRRRSASCRTRPTATLWPMGPFFVAGRAGRTSRRGWSSGSGGRCCCAWPSSASLPAVPSARPGRRPAPRCVAAFAFALTPRITTLVGAVSVEIWPMALAPWVLLPLVRGRPAGLGAARGGAQRAGGGDAAAASTRSPSLAVLPLGVVWLVTRARARGAGGCSAGGRGFTVLATLWWLVPLLLLGALQRRRSSTTSRTPRSPRFRPSSRARCSGTSDWVAYFGGMDFAAGQAARRRHRSCCSTPPLVVAAGAGRHRLRGNPHRRFLLPSACSPALVLVGLGYAGDLAGFFAGRPELAGRCAGAAAQPAQVRRRAPHPAGARPRPRAGGAARLCAGTASARRRGCPRGRRRSGLVGAALAVVHGRIAAHAGRRGGARLLAARRRLPGRARRRHGGPRAPRVLVRRLRLGQRPRRRPAGSGDAARGRSATWCRWRSPATWCSSTPSPGPSSPVDPSPTLARRTSRPTASAAGGAQRPRPHRRPAHPTRPTSARPDPDRPGSPWRSFGPDGRRSRPTATAPDAEQTRIVTGSGISPRPARRRRLHGPRTGRGHASPTPRRAARRRPVVGPLARLSGLPRRATPPARGRRRRATDAPGQVLTDDMKRREMNFPAVRWNESSTLPADRRSGSPARSSHTAWSTTRSGGRHRSHGPAGSSRGRASIVAGLRRRDAAARDRRTPGRRARRRPGTAWQSARDLDPNGQWWQVDLHPRPSDRSRSPRVGPATSVAGELRISRRRTDAQVVEAPAPGSGGYLPGGPSGAALACGSPPRAPARCSPGRCRSAEVRSTTCTRSATSTCRCPTRPIPVDVVSLTPGPGPRRPACQVGDALPVRRQLVLAPGEDGDTLARRFTLPPPDAYRLAALASLRRTDRRLATAAAGTRGRRSAAAERTEATSRGAAGRWSTATLDHVDWRTDPAAADQLTLLHSTSARSARSSSTLNPERPPARPHRVEAPRGDTQRASTSTTSGRGRPAGAGATRRLLAARSSRPIRRSPTRARVR